jgi:hypothetical protein
LSNQPQRIEASNAAFEAAVSLHRQGRLFVAEQMYLARLKSMPGHFGALHNMGLLRVQQGRLEEAAGLIR